MSVSAAWNKDWKPGPYPKTEAERAAAAKRYGLRPEDYEPYSADGFGHGDYPKLPIVSEESKYPYEDFDIPEIKRNFGEPVSIILFLICLSLNACFHHQMNIESNTQFNH